MHACSLGTGLCYKIILCRPAYTLNWHRPGALKLSTCLDASQGHAPVDVVRGDGLGLAAGATRKLINGMAP